MKIRISRTEPGACVQAVQATRAVVGDDIDTDGYLTVPDTPGLGAEIDESAVTRWRIP
jgi:L-alanine-DL-glutamate epimerase-like enolase superfamily enzyme